MMFLRSAIPSLVSIFRYVRIHRVKSPALHYSMPGARPDQFTSSWLQGQPGATTSLRERPEAGGMIDGVGQRATGSAWLGGLSAAKDTRRAIFLFVCGRDDTLRPRTMQGKRAASRV